MTTETDPRDRSMVQTESSARSKKIFAVALVVVLVLFPIMQFVVGGGLNYWLHMLLYIFMYVAMASSWNIIGGFAGYTSLGHNVFFAIGGYVAGVLAVYVGVSAFLTAPLAGLVAMLVGFLVGLISLRTRGPAFIISTIAMILVVKIVFDNWGLLGGAGGLSTPYLDLPVDLIKFPYYYSMLVVAIGSVFLAYRIRHSKFGLGLRAISQDEIKAEVAGVPTSQYKILAFAISAIFVGIAGALWGSYLTYLKPNIFLTIGIATHMVLMTVLGGKGTVTGPVVGAVVFIAINEFLVARLGSTELNIVAVGLLLVLVLLFFPKGIVGTLKERDKLPAILDWD